MSSDKKPIATVSLESQLIRKRLEECEVGDLVTYDQLKDITKREILDCRGAFYTASRQLFVERGWLFGSVRGIGYKRLNPAEKLDSAEDRRKRINRSAKKGMKVMASIESDKLDPSDRTRHFALSSGLGAIQLATSNKSMRLLQEASLTSPLPPKETLKLFA
jgi:hypothetical protein